MAVKNESTCRNLEAGSSLGESSSDTMTMTMEMSYNYGHSHSPGKSPLHLACTSDACDECMKTVAFSRPCGGASRCYTLCEVRRHSTGESAWLVAGDDIYDATEYLNSNQHPGGKVSILKKAGGVADCAEDLHFHSRNGRKMWQKYHVGKLVPCKGLHERQWWQFWA